jgi:hypothetical protein
MFSDNILRSDTTYCEVKTSLVDLIYCFDNGRCVNCVKRNQNVYQNVCTKMFTYKQIGLSWNKTHLY